jgi:hypothetical protein
MISITPCNPWSPLIYKLKYDFNFSELEPLLENSIKDAQENSYLENGAAVSSVVNNDSRPHYWPNIQKFLDSIAPSINQILDSWSIEQRPWFIGNSWANKHLEGGYTSEHHHGRHVAVIAAYPMLPENSGYIQFKNPLEYHWSQSYLKDYDNDSLWSTIKCETNDVLVFPGWLRHRTQLSNSHSPRWVMTFNISQREKI